MRNEVNNSIKKVKKSYYYKTFETYNGNSRKTWETINEVTRRKSGKATINELKLNGARITNSTEIAEGFNKFFAEIGPELSRDLEEVGTSFDEFVIQASSCFSFQRVTRLHVLSQLNKLCKRKATGLDSVSARLLRECPDLISGSLALIFNQSIDTGIFPDEWMSARITPLFKKAGSRSDPSNYRPISIIPVVAKVFERIIYDQLYHYLNENDLLSQHQSGFRSLHSTVTALIEATDNWSLNIDRGFINAVVFLDLKKAFDTVDHNILLSKLQAYGIHGSTNQWFCSYLKNRTQTCLVNGNKSSEMFLRCGVPQGTDLGPLLFLLYINDLPNCLRHSQPRMYADDTSITFVGSDVDEMNNCINLDLERICVWLAANKLTLNTSKTEFLLIGSKQRLVNSTAKPTASINQFPIKQVSTVKSLGVHIDENFTWECHVNELSKKIASGISAMKRIRHTVPCKTLLSIYNSLVQPHFDYCSSVWGSCSKNLSQKLQKLQKLQNRAARVITFSNYDRSTNELLRMVNWVKLDRQRLVDKSIMIYKIVNRMVPDYLSLHFVFRSDTLTYILRGSDFSLAISQPRTNYCKRSLLYSGAVLWNSLQLDIRQSLSLDVFKYKLKSYDFDGRFA